jgi:hypothetical protein
MPSCVTPGGNGFSVAGVLATISGGAAIGSE